MEKAVEFLVRYRHFLAILMTITLFVTTYFGIEQSLYFQILGFILVSCGAFLYSYASKVDRMKKDFFENSLFQKVRHPETTGIILVCLGVLSISSNLASVLASAFWILIFVSIASAEEKIWQEKFGKTYEEYAKRVKHRFIPGLI